MTTVMTPEMMNLRPTPSDTMIRLHNQDWGFDTNCFVCESRNDHGLRIPFFHDTAREVVVARFELGRAFSGAPTLVHGGVTLAILDEAMAWACIAVGQRWAVTTETTTRFHKGVRVDRTYRVEAEIIGTSADQLRCRAVVLDHHDLVRAEAHATFATLGEAQAVRLSGAELTEPARGYVADASRPAGAAP